MKVIVIYESTRGRTKAMAEAIGEGARSAGAECDVIDARKLRSLDDACALAIGSSTRVKKVLPKVKQILAGLTALDGRPAAAFGSYGWGGGSKRFIEEQMKAAGIELVDNELEFSYKPTLQEWNKAYNFGKIIGERIKA